MVKIPGFHCYGMGSIHGQETDPTDCRTWPKKKKEFTLYSEIMDLLDSLVLKGHVFHERVMLMSGLLNIKA